MSIKNKLTRYKQHLSLNEDKKHNKIQNEEIKDNQIVNSNINIQVDTIPYVEIWEENGVKPYFFDGKYSLIKEKVYPVDHQHGMYKFSEILVATEHWNNSDINHPLSNKGIPISEMIFFDTETTGLGGGAGTYIFLLSYARVLKDKVIVRQHILPDPSCEVALYHGFLSEVGQSVNLLASYNGKAFDWPQVKTRHTLVRDHVPKLPAFGHFDLYHASRRMWKHKLERLKLSIVEKEVLGIERKEDVPGFLAPIIYFDFLERKNPEGLIGILKHNEQDILSLITLYIHLSYQLLRLDKQQTVSETFEVGRWYSALGQTDLAKDTFIDAVREDQTDSVKAMNALAFEYKRSKEWEKAIPLWAKAAEIGAPEIQMEACIELAKIYEHRMKDIELAIKFSEQAVLVYKERISGNDGFLQGIEKRLIRLKKKGHR